MRYFIQNKTGKAAAITHTDLILCSISLFTHAASPRSIVWGPMVHLLIQPFRTTINTIMFTPAVDICLCLLALTSSWRSLATVYIDWIILAMTADPNVIWIAKYDWSLNTGTREREWWGVRRQKTNYSEHRKHHDQTLWSKYLASNVSPLLFFTSCVTCFWWVHW